MNSNKGAVMTVIENRSIAQSALDATRALLPQLRDRAAQAVLDRRLPQQNIQDLIEAGSFKTIQPKRVGGYGLGMRDHLDMISMIARGCGSTAWVAGVVHAHSWLLSHFDAKAQDEIYGANPNAIVSAVIGPRGTANKVSGGYLLSGTWPFASGCERSNWLLLGGVVLNNGEIVDEGDFALQTSEAKIADDWRVVGLGATGSCTVTVEDLFVPEHRFLSLPALIQGSSPGMNLHDGWSAKCAPVPVLALALTGAAVGLARQALEDFPALIKGKTIAYTADSKFDHPATHIELAEAVIKIDEGEMLLYRTADGIDEAAQNGTEIPFLTRARMRLDCAEGVRRLLEGVEILFELSGASGIRTSSPLTRAVADLRVINQHGLLDIRTNREMYGRVHLGLEPNTPLI